MKGRIAFAAIAALSLLAMSDVAAAQQNPFVPKGSGGLSREQVQEIVRQQVEAQKPSTPEPSPGSPAPSAPGAPAPATDGIPSQPNPGGPGAPSGSPVSGAPGQGPGPSMIVVASDPVDALISDGGSFVGCVRNVPIFRDKVGRRIYFTTKELKNSEAIRRYARC